MKILKLFIAQLIISLGIALVINSSLGAFPITLTNLSISNLTNLSFGLVSMLVEMFVVVICLFMKQHVGLATLINAILGGYFIDFILLFLPLPNTFIFKLLFVILGSMVLIYGFYIQGKQGLGKSSTNLLTAAIRRKTGCSITTIKTIQEVSFVLIGLLGAYKSFGIATIILSLFFGKLMDVIYNKLNYDPAKITHKTLF